MTLLSQWKEIAQLQGSAITEMLGALSVSKSIASLTPEEKKARAKSMPVLLVLDYLLHRDFAGEWIAARLR
jgi:hypothetical protein